MQKRKRTYVLVWLCALQRLVLTEHPLVGFLCTLSSHAEPMAVRSQEPDLAEET